VTGTAASYLELISAVVVALAPIALDLTIA
jgi:hypothetical protein